MGEKILVVDDHPAVVGLISDALMAQGFTVLSAENGTDGLAVIEEQDPDLVILDITMPVMSGLEVLRALRSKPETLYLPVILLTGRDGHADVLDGWMGGADRYLTKPCNIGELLAAGKEMLGAPARQ
jgi:DNA-binding response OmpR family regulator